MNLLQQLGNLNSNTAVSIIITDLKSHWSDDLIKSRFQQVILTIFYMSQVSVTITTIDWSRSQLSRISYSQTPIISNGISLFRKHSRQFSTSPNLMIIFDRVFHALEFVKTNSKKYEFTLSRDLLIIVTSAPFRSKLLVNRNSLNLIPINCLVWTSTKLADIYFVKDKYHPHLQTREIDESVLGESFKIYEKVDFASFYFLTSYYGMPASNDTASSLQLNSTNFFKDDPDTTILIDLVKFLNVTLFNCFKINNCAYYATKSFIQQALAITPNNVHPTVGFSSVSWTPFLEEMGASDTQFLVPLSSSSSGWIGLVSPLGYQTGILMLGSCAILITMFGLIDFIMKLIRQNPIPVCISTFLPLVEQPINKLKSFPLSYKLLLLVWLLYCIFNAMFYKSNLIKILIKPQFKPGPRNFRDLILEGSHFFSLGMIVKYQNITKTTMVPYNDSLESSNNSPEISILEEECYVETCDARRILSNELLRNARNKFEYNSIINDLGNCRFIEENVESSLMRILQTGDAMIANTRSLKAVEELYQEKSTTRKVQWSEVSIRSHRYIQVYNDIFALRALKFLIWRRDSGVLKKLHDWKEDRFRSEFRESIFRNKSALAEIIHTDYDILRLEHLHVVFELLGCWSAGASLFFLMEVLLFHCISRWHLIVTIKIKHLLV